MIKYKKGIFGLNLLFRMHGSAIYRAVVPATLSSLIFCAWSLEWEKPPQSELLHPYAAGVIIGGITFLLVFRVTQSYGRYWEATGAVYRMQSKWMDAAVHVANYHMQSSQYDEIRPPRYSEHHYLNEHRLTRDRERVRSSRLSLGTTGKISTQRAQQKSIEILDAKGDLSKMVGMTPSFGEESPSTTDLGVIPVLNTMVKSARHSMRRSMTDPLPKRVLVSRISSRRFESAASQDSCDSVDSGDDENVTESERPPQFLTGPPRTDGNWGKLFDDRHSTYLKPENLSEIDHNGFASIQGGRTPILFLQELAHLASLMNAVALSTLRNDVEGVSSPLSLYIPGSAWPAVDPKWDKNLYDSKLEGWLYAMLYFLGQGRSPFERAKYNVARPLPVLGGVSDAEIQMLQMARGAMAKTQLCFGWLSELAVREHIEHGALLARIMQFLSDGMLAYNDCRKIMFNPFPFPFAQVTSFFVCFMWIIVPLLMDQYIKNIWLGVVLSFFSVMCLQSIDEVAKELENPFRNIPNELPVVTYQAEFNESLLTIYSGFHPDSFWKPPRALQPRHDQKMSSQSPDHDDMSTIKEASFRSESGSPSESEKPVDGNKGNNNSGGHKEMNEHLRSIVEQQGRMMEQMMNEQKRLNRALEKVLNQTMNQKPEKNE